MNASFTADVRGGRTILPSVGSILCAVLACLAMTSVRAADYPATLHWAQRVELGVPVSGIVAQVQVRVGDAVDPGDELLSLKSPPFEAALQHAKADVARLSALRNEARREQTRAEELYARTVLSDHDLQVAKDAYTSADAQYQAASATLKKAEIDFGNSVIKATLPAWVLQRLAEPGQTVISNLQSAPLLVLAARGRMLAQAALTGEELAAIQRDTEAQVEVAGQSYAGKVVTVGMEPLAANSGDSTPRYAVQVEFAHDETVLLRAGQPATVKLP